MGQARSEINFEVKLLGKIWAGHTSARDLVISQRMLNDFGSSALSDIEKICMWVDHKKNLGDFESITDFWVLKVDMARVEMGNVDSGHTTIETTVRKLLRPWKTEENESEYWDCMDGGVSRDS